MLLVSVIRTLIVNTHSTELNGEYWITTLNMTQINKSMNICFQYGINCSNANQIWYINGSIPKTIGNLLNLTFLDISYLDLLTSSEAN